MKQSAHNQLFALLIGIDNYPDRVPKLQGCVNDINAIESLLLTKYNSFDIHVKKYLNHEATRTNIINGFRNHLSKARNGDTVLFYYSGHGSRENSPKEFWAESPDRKNETLVCFDSRLGGGFDLADKELAVLINEVAVNNPHIVICLDCCHSGSGTRDTVELMAARQVEKVGNERQIGEYLDGYYEKQYTDSGKITIPQSSHVLLSACQFNEKAYETANKHGLFTTSLLTILNKEKQGGNTYSELFQSLSIDIRATQRTQHPNFEYYGGFNPHSLFLTGQPTDRIKTFPVFFDTVSNQWKAGKGAIHGLPVENLNPVEIWIFDEGTSDYTFLNRIADAEFKKIEVEESSLDVEGSLDKGKKYIGFQVGSSSNNISVFSEIPASDLLALNEYQIADKQELTDYWVLKNDAKMQVVHNLSKKIISESDVLENINTSLQKIARWENLKKLNNPKTRIYNNGIELNLEIEGSSFKGNELEISLAQDENDKIQTRPYSISVQNSSGQELYFKLLFISPLYGIVQLGATIISNGQSGILVQNTKMGFFQSQINDSESNCVFKLVASTQEIDLSYYEQDNFSLNTDFRTKSIKKAYRAKFIDELEGELPSSLDWTTKDIKLRLVKANNEIGEKEVAIANRQIKIRPHSSLKAKVSLTEIFNASRGNESSEAILLSTVPKKGASLLSFKDSTKSVSAFQLVELQEITGDISQEDPLVLDIENDTIQANEYLFPVTIDGDDIVVIGNSQRNSSGINEVFIERLPETGHTRNISRAIKFCLMKLVFKSNPEDFFTLRWVDFSTDTPTRKSDGVAEKVQEADTILLLIHGIIGDTEGILPFAKKIAKSHSDNAQKPFDIVLTFDYECLNTPISKIASNLKHELSKIGIKDTSNKKITILSHSMGGLVSRIFIEKLGGAKSVDKLIMAGTPNGGSVFGKLPDYLSFTSDLLTLGLSIAAFTPYLTWAAGLAVTLKKSDKITVTLGEMETDSDFIRELVNNADPKIPYYILAGRVDEYSTHGVSWKDSFLKKLVVGAGNLFHKGELHDIAVYTSSIEKVDNHRNPKPIIQEIACPHVFYFDESASTAILYEWLGA